MSETRAQARERLKSHGMKPPEIEQALAGANPATKHAWDMAEQAQANQSAPDPSTNFWQQVLGSLGKPQQPAASQNNSQSSQSPGTQLLEFAFNPRVSTAGTGQGTIGATPMSLKDVEQFKNMYAQNQAANPAPAPTPIPQGVPGAGVISNLGRQIVPAAQHAFDVVKNTFGDMGNLPGIADANRFLYGTGVNQRTPAPAPSSIAPAPVPPPAPPPAPPATGGSMMSVGGGRRTQASGNPAPTEQPWLPPEMFTPQQVNMNSGITDAAAALQEKYKQLDDAVGPDIRTGWAGLAQRLAPALTKFAQTGNVGDLAGGMAEFDEKQRQQMIEGIQAGMGGDELKLKLAQAQQQLDMSNAELVNAATMRNQEAKYGHSRDVATFNEQGRQFNTTRADRAHEFDVTTGLQRQQIGQSAASSAAAEEARVLQNKVLQAQILAGFGGVPEIRSRAALTGLDPSQQNDLVQNDVRTSMYQAAQDNNSRKVLNTILPPTLKIHNARDLNQISLATEWLLRPENIQQYKLLGLNSGSIPTRRER